MLYTGRDVIQIVKTALTKSVATGKHGGSDRENNTVIGEFDWSDTDPSIAIINGIAAIENVDSVDLLSELDTALFNYIDPEALDTLVSTDGHIAILFTIDNCRIQIDGGELAISFG